MLYLIDPRGAVWSADATLGRARARQRVDGRPLDDLPFTKAAMVLDLEDFVDLALRHGVAAPRGILLDHGFVECALAPSKLKQERRNQEQVAAQLAPVTRCTEDDDVALYRRDALHEEADRRLAERIEKAESTAREILQAEPRRDLLDHWKALGGAVPATVTADLGHDAGR